MLPIWLTHTEEQIQAAETAVERRRTGRKHRSAASLAVNHPRTVGHPDAAWYAMSRVNTHGRYSTPHSNRYCRQDFQWQFDAVIELALDFAIGAAAVRTEGRSFIGEHYWLWHRAGEDRPEFWMIPFRIHHRALALYEAAKTNAYEWARACGESTFRDHDIAQILRGWRASGSWRKHVPGAFARRVEKIKAVENAKKAATAKTRAKRLPV